MGSNPIKLGVGSLSDGEEETMCALLPADHRHCLDLHKHDVFRCFPISKMWGVISDFRPKIGKFLFNIIKLYFRILENLPPMASFLLADVPLHRAAGFLAAFPIPYFSWGNGERHGINGLQRQMGSLPKADRESLGGGGCKGGSSPALAPPAFLGPLLRCC